MVHSFGDLGKSARDIFDKNFNFGLINFEFKTKTENDIAVTCGGKHDTSANRVSGFLESKVKPTKGVSLKTKVDSSWVVTSDLEIEKKLHHGLSHNVVSTVETESGIPNYTALCLGAQAIFDTQKTALTKYVYAANFKKDDLQVHAALTDHSNFDLSVFQKHKKVKLGFKVGWQQETRDTTFAAAVRYKPASHGKMKIKVDQNCIIGLAYKLKLDSDTSVTLCTQLDGKNLEGSSQKFGMMFKFGD